MSFEQPTPAEVAEIWWSNYREALAQLGVEWPPDTTSIEGVLVGVGGHRLAARAADGLTKRLVPGDAWRAYRNDRKSRHRGPGRPRQAQATRRGSRGWTKAERRGTLRRL